MFSLEKHPLVDCDLEEAALWYAARSATIAERFITAVEAALRGVGRERLRQRVRFADARRANLAGFPYAAFYVVLEERVFILAVLHAARDRRAVLERRPLVE